MPRLARIDAAGILHHVIIRGIEKKPIFSSNADRKDFLERLSGRTWRSVLRVATNGYSFILNVPPLT